MLNKEILIYRNSSELRKYISSAEQPVLKFEFGKIQTQIHENADIVIDITSMVNHVKAFLGDQITAEVNLNALEDETTVIGALLLTRRDAHECLKSCSLISLTPALFAISPFLR